MACHSAQGGERKKCRKGKSAFQGSVTSRLVVGCSPPPDNKNGICQEDEIHMVHVHEMSKQKIQKQYFCRKEKCAQLASQFTYDHKFMGFVLGFVDRMKLVNFVELPRHLIGITNYYHFTSKVY